MHAFYCVYCCYFMPNIFAMSGIWLCVVCGVCECVCECKLGVLWASPTLITAPDYVPVISPSTLCYLNLVL